MSSRRRSVSGSARGDGAGPSRPPADPLSEGEFTWTSDEDHINLQKCHYRHMRWESEAKGRLKHGTSEKPKKYKMLDYFYFETDLHIGNLKEDTTNLMRWKMKNVADLRGTKATGLMEMIIRTLMKDVEMVNEEKQKMADELQAFSYYYSKATSNPPTKVKPTLFLQDPSPGDQWTYSTGDPTQGPPFTYDNVNQNPESKQSMMLNHFYHQTEDCVDALKRETIRLFQWEWDQEKKREEGEEEIEKGSIGMRAIVAVLERLMDDVELMAKEMDEIQTELVNYRILIKNKPDEVLRRQGVEPLRRPYSESPVCRTRRSVAAASAAAAADNQQPSTSRPATESPITSQPTGSSIGSSSPAVKRVAKKKKAKTATVTPQLQSASGVSK